MSGTREAPFWCEPATTIDNATGDFVPHPRGICFLMMYRTGKGGRKVSPKTLFGGPRGYIEAAANALNNLHAGKAPEAPRPTPSEGQTR